MKAPSHIETPRLLLSVPREEDAQAIFERYAGDAEVCLYLGWPRHRSIADTRAFLALSAREWERWPGGPYVIRARTDGHLLGGTGFAFEAPHLASTGYVLAKDAWGRGFATEALTAIVALAPLVGVERLYALCHQAHDASARVLEKCGFARDTSWSREVEFPNLSPGVPQQPACYAIAFGAPSEAAARPRMLDGR